MYQAILFLPLAGALFAGLLIMSSAVAAEAQFVDHFLCYKARRARGDEPAVDPADRGRADH